MKPLHIFSLLALLLPASVLAQEDIIVTALGRATRDLQTPDTVGLISARELGEKHLVSLDDVLAQTTGVHLIAGDQDPGVNLITIRGLSSNRGQEPSVGFVVDGQPLPESELFTLRPFDLARVEVLKGPQGALFGRSASGGVVVYATAEPQTTTHANASIGYGNGDSLTSAAMLNLPVNDRIALRIAWSSIDEKGTLYNSTVRALVDDIASRNLRIKARIELSDATRLSLRAAYATEEAGAANVIMGEFTRSSGGRLDPARFVDPYGDLPGRATRRWWGVQAVLDHRFADGGTLRFNLAYDDYHKEFLEEFDFLPFKPITYLGEPVYPDGVQPIRQPVNLGALTLDARYTSSDAARMRWIAGLFFQNVRRDRTDDFQGFGLPPYLYRTRSTQLGLFAQAQADLGGSLEATLALRYDQDDRRQRLSDESDVVLDQRSNRFSAFQPKASLLWKVSPTLSAFATGSIGFKSGGFNPLPVPGDPPYALTFPAERSRGLELGMKFATQSLRAALALYTTRLDNFQNTIFLTNNIVFSVPRVVIRGAEASLDWQASPSLSLSASGVYTDARVRRYSAPNPTPERGEPDSIDYSGKRLVNSPDYQLQAGLRWTQSIAGTKAAMRLDYRRTGSIHYELDNILTAPAHDAVDASLSLQASGFTVQLWAKNLFDARWATSAYGQQQLAFLRYLGPGGPYDSYTVNSARRWGASLGRAF